MTATKMMDTFPIMRRNENAPGEYRTTHVVPAASDEIGDAARVGVPLLARLDRPPDDPRAAHLEAVVDA